MIRNRTIRFCLAACLGLFLAGSYATLAADAVKPTSAPIKVLLENDRVKVVEIDLAPGSQAPSHSHPDHVIYLLGDAKIKETLPDGKIAEISGKKGQALWHAAVTHVTENIGTTPTKAIIVELKVPSSAPVATPPDKDPVKLAPDYVKVIFENDRIRVLEVRAKPGAKVPMHVHPARVTYHLTDAKLKVTDANNAVTEISLKAGDVAWNLPLSHAVENVGPAEAVIIEFETK